MICHRLSTKDINEIAKQLNKGFESICGCFFDNKVSIHFGDDKTKSKLFGTKFKIKKVRKLLCNCRQLLCNALIQSYFDYACSAWYPNSTKKLKNRIQTSQNKCKRFCLQLDKMKHISHKYFKTLNWLHVTERFNQCFNSIAFRYINDQCPNYVNEVFQTAPENNIQTRGSFLKLKFPFHKTNAGQMALSYIGPTIWRKTHDTLKQTKNRNTFNHN